MVKTNKKNKLDDLVEKQISPWKKEAAWRIANRNWLKQSARIAMHVLDRMDALGWNQKKLAEQMGTSQQYISKLCKGQENLTLKQIVQLEEELGVKLLVIGEEKTRDGAK